MKQHETEQTHNVTVKNVPDFYFVPGKTYFGNYCYDGIDRSDYMTVVKRTAKTITFFDRFDHRRTAKVFMDKWDGMSVEYVKCFPLSRPLAFRFLRDGETIEQHDQKNLENSGFVFA